MLLDSLIWHGHTLTICDPQPQLYTQEPYFNGRELTPHDVTEAHKQIRILMGSAVVTLLQDSKFDAADRVTDYGDRLWDQETFKASVKAADSNRHWRARLSNEDGIMTSKSLP